VAHLPGTKMTTDTINKLNSIRSKHAAPSLYDNTPLQSVVKARAVMPIY